MTHGPDGLWYATFETDGHFDEPELAIAAMIAAVESLEEPHRSSWLDCSVREFDLGYECGDEPWAFNQGLSSALLARMANVAASLRITIYPDRQQSG